MSAGQQLILNRDVIAIISPDCYLLFLGGIEIVYFALDFSLVQL
jgi:hypothetical protein